MTLRAWSLLIIIGLFALILSAHARADELAPGVFEQMQAPTQNALVVGLKSSGDSMTYDLKIGSQVRSLQLCPEGKQAFIGEGPMGDILRQAFTQKLTVVVGVTGPWQACVRTVHVIQGA